MATASKKQRLSKLLAICPTGVSDASLARVLASIKDDPNVLNDANTKTRAALGTMKREQLFDAAITADLNLQNGDIFHWSIVPPVVLMNMLFQRSLAFSQLYDTLLQSRPCSMDSPWRLICYHDELTPGNIIKPDNRRKLSVFYVNYLELNQHLRSEFTWLPIACLRHNIMQQVVGGMSACVRAIASALFLHESGFTATGQVLHLGSVPKNYMFWAQMENLLADEAALKASWNSKGASGLKPCFLCLNATCKSLGGLDSSHYLADISCPNIDMFQAAKSVC